MERFAQVQQFLSDYSNFYHEIMQFEAHKLSSLLNNDIEAIEKNILTQQANMMRMDAIERKRESVLTKLGFEHMTFSHVITSFTGQEKADLTAIYGQLSENLKHIQYLNQKSMEMAKLVLSMYETKIMNDYKMNDMGQG